MILYFISTLTIFLLAPFHEALWANCHKASVVIWKILNIRFTSAFCCHFNKPALSNKVCMYQEAMPWVPEVFSRVQLDYEQSLFFLCPSSETPETHKWPHARLKVRDRRGMTKPSFLVSCSFSTQRKCTRALPLLNLMKKRGCLQSRVQRYSLTFPKQKQVISCLICGTKWNKKRQNKTLCQVHLTLSKTETFRTGILERCPSYIES